MACSDAAGSVCALAKASAPLTSGRLYENGRLARRAALRVQLAEFSIRQFCRNGVLRLRGSYGTYLALDVSIFVDHSADRVWDSVFLYARTC